MYFFLNKMQTLKITSFADLTSWIFTKRIREKEKFYKSYRKQNARNQKFKEQK